MLEMNSNDQNLQSLISKNPKNSQYNISLFNSSILNKTVQ